MRQLVITTSITRRDQKSLKQYLNDISKYDVLTPDEELQLFRQYKNGDERAFQQILNHNLRFVVSVAKKYQHTGLWLGDLINEGNIGLIKAARRFDETKGFKFISYAVWWIRQSILQALNDRGRKIRIPANQVSISYKIREARVRFLQTKERKATISELAKATGLSEHVIRRSEKFTKRCRSLDAPLSEDGDATVVEIMEDEEIRQPDFEVAVNESQSKEVEQLLDQLNPRQAEILSMYYGIGREYPSSLSDISEMMGISRERIRQIKDKSVRKLRRKFKSRMQATFA